MGKIKNPAKTAASKISRKTKENKPTKINKALNFDGFDDYISIDDSEQLKTQSISQRDYKETAKDIEKKLKENFEIVQKTDLLPFHKKHFFYILKKK